MSLQAIEDFYVQRGYRGERLRVALAKDRSYQRALAEKAWLLSRRYRMSAAERQKYMLRTDEDFAILGECKALRKRALSAADRGLVRLIETQLLHDWRAPLRKELQRLRVKYR